MSSHVPTLRERGEKKVSVSTALMKEACLRFIAAIINIRQKRGGRESK